MTRLYSLGSNGNFQLSLGHDEDTSTPTLCRLPGELVASDAQDWQIECGGNHTLLLTKGQLYASGSNEHNQLGLSSQQSIPCFTRIHAQTSWSKAACGFDYSILVSATHELYSMGRSDKGALGLQDISQTSNIQQVPFDMQDRQIVDVKASLNHVIVLLTDNTLWGWGSTRKGTLGPHHEQHCLTRPTQISLCPANEIPNHIGIGKDWSLVVTNLIIYYAGPKNRWNTHDVENVSFQDITSVSCNWSSVHLLTQDGRILSSGRDDRGQFAPPNLPHITRLVSGSEHSVGLAQDGQVYVWGWNEHGNCGPGTADVTTIRALSLPPDIKIMGCAAGYGTTFVWTTD